MAVKNMSSVIQRTSSILRLSGLLKDRHSILTRCASTARQTDIVEPSTEALFTSEHQEIKRSLRKV